MNAPFEPRDDFEAQLAAAMRAEVDHVVPAGDGLAKIRARTQARAGFFSWLTRPAAAGGVLVVALVAATVAGMQLAGDGSNDDVVVQPKPDPIATTYFDPAGTITNDQSDVERYNPDPGPDTCCTGGEEPEVTATLTPPEPNTLKLAPVTPQQDQRRSDDGIPVDDGHSNYVAITAPLSGRSYSSPLTIAGQARVFEANVTIDISQNGTVLQQTHATATQGAPELGDWQVTIALDPGAYRVDAYALSPKDGETRLASDSIWITIRSPEGATQPTPTPTPSPSPTAGPSATPTATVPPRSDVPGD